MTWSTPLTAVSNTALTAAQWNASVRDNLLETAPAKATAAGQHFVSTGANAIAARAISAAAVATSETTTSTTYTDLATSGPAVTVTTGTRALVGISAFNQTSGVSAGYMSFAVSGASTIAATDDQATGLGGGGGGAAGRTGIVVLLTALTAGSNTFTAKYRAAGAVTGTWQDRKIWVIPW